MIPIDPVRYPKLVLALGGNALIRPREAGTLFPRANVAQALVSSYLSYIRMHKGWETTFSAINAYCYRGGHSQAGVAAGRPDVARAKHMSNNTK